MERGALPYYRRRLGNNRRWFLPTSLPRDERERPLISGNKSAPVFSEPSCQLPSGLSGLFLWVNPSLLRRVVPHLLLLLDLMLLEPLHLRRRHEIRAHWP